MFFQRTQENDNDIKTELSVGNNYQYSTAHLPTGKLLDCLFL